MIVAKVARLADASGVESPIRVLAQLSHLIPPLGMVAILAHARSVVVFVDMLAFGDDLTVLNLALTTFIDLSCVFPLLFARSRRRRHQRGRRLSRPLIVLVCLHRLLARTNFLFFI